jgi:hypothetical protein
VRAAALLACSARARRSPRRARASLLFTERAHPTPILTRQSSPTKNKQYTHTPTKNKKRYALKASYLEIYNEAVFDLIHFDPKASKGGLPVKWDAAHGFYVAGLKVVPCGQMRTMMEVACAVCCVFWGWGDG